MKVRIKKLDERAVIPAYAHSTDAGMDLVATGKEYDEYGNTVYHTGLAFEIPEGHVGLVFPRSSNAKKDLFLTNSVGVIDSGYRGEITFKFRSTVNRVPWWTSLAALLGKKHGKYCLLRAKEYEVGDRIGQIIILPYPHIEFQLAKKLSNTDRGKGGYGSTGK